MKSAIYAYKELAQKENLNKDLYRLYVELDKKIAAALEDDGYGTEQIERAILKASPAVKGKTPEAIDMYLKGQVSRDLPENGLGVHVDDAYERQKESYYTKFEELLLKKDLAIFCKLLDEGYSLKEVLEAHRKNSLLSGQFTDAKLLDNYADNVLGHVNRERILKTGKMYDLAKKLYLEKVASLTDKYASYSLDKFNAFHEGSIVLSMMVEHNFFPEVIEEVLRRNSPFSKLNEAYISDVMSKCQESYQAYIDIQRMTTVKDVHTEEDAYKFFARDYMKRTHTKILAGRDDQTIVGRLFAENFPKDLVKTALNASPVAKEPGRNKEAYVEGLLSAVEKDYENKKAFAIKQYPVTAALYDEKIERIDRRLKEKGYALGVEKNRSYYDGIVAKELLEEKQSSVNIARVIAEKSPLAIKENPNKPNKTPESYANWIASAAGKVLRTEKDLLTWEKKDIPKNTSYKKLIEAGFTPVDLFKQAIHERLQAYPSFSAMLTAPFVDKDISEKLLNRYPDFDKFELHEVIKHHSPRALMPGIPENYVVKVIDEVDHRLEAAKKKETYTKTVQEEYNKQCGLASEGVNIDVNMSLYQDGRAALRMLLNHIDPADVRAAIIAAAQTAAVVAPLVYADDVLHKAEAVRDRMEIIKEHTPIPEPVTADEEYKNRITQLYNEKKFLQSSMDAVIFKDMLLENKYKTSEIKQAIQDNSPIAIEPGRDNKYESFVEAQAKARISQEKLKLQHYRPVPRIEHNEKAIDEYEQHRLEMEKAIDLPFAPQMDVLIAETMIIQGFEKLEIIEALDGSSCSSVQSNYGVSVFKKAERSLEQQQNRDQSLVRSLIKTTDVTTTTTTNVTEN